MDISVYGLRDRRIAASDETTATSGGRIYGVGSRARTNGAHSATGFDRSVDSIRAIILHQTSVNVTFLEGRHRYPEDDTTDEDIQDEHRIDRVCAHFVVLLDGSIFYTHDVQYISASAGGRLGIDIEFAGHFPNSLHPNESQRLSHEAIRAGRNLVRALKTQIPSITHIHPHGQVQRREFSDGTTVTCGGYNSDNVCGKINSCPGPDIWMNVGEPCVRELHLISDETLSGYQNNEITDTDIRRRGQRNPLYDQHVVN